MLGKDIRQLLQLSSIFTKVFFTIGCRIVTIILYVKMGTFFVVFVSKAGKVLIVAWRKQILSTDPYVRLQTLHTAFSCQDLGEVHKLLHISICSTHTGEGNILKTLLKSSTLILWSSLQCLPLKKSTRMNCQGTSKLLEIMPSTCTLSDL